MTTLLTGAECAPGELHRRCNARASGDADQRSPTPARGDTGGRADTRERSDAPHRGIEQLRGSIRPAHVTGGDRLSRGLARVGQHVVLPLARTVGALAAQKAWFSFGYRNLDDFARERLHKSGRWCRDLRQLHKALDEFQELGLAMSGADGGKPISQKAAQCIGRVATSDDVGCWIARARELSLPALQRGVETAVVQNRASSEGAGVQGQGESRDGERANADASATPAASSEARVTIRISGPPEAKIAFDAVKELHVAVVG